MRPNQWGIPGDELDPVVGGRFNRLEGLPLEVGSLLSLERLELANNRLTERLPEGVFALPRLASLQLTRNVAIGPPSLGRLSLLRELEVSGCGLSALPPSLGSLQRLETLWANDNGIEVLPSDIGDLKALRTLWVASIRVELESSTTRHLRRHFTLREFERRSGRWGVSDLRGLDER